MTDKIEPYYQRRAADFVDTLFDMGYFTEELTRKDMQAVEDLLAFDFQSISNSTKKSVEMLRKIRETVKE